MLKWDWDNFPEYLDAADTITDDLHRGTDTASPLRVYVKPRSPAQDSLSLGLGH
jgi:hypothetical protein